MKMAACAVLLAITAAPDTSGPEAAPATEASKIVCAIGKSVELARQMGEIEDEFAVFIEKKEDASRVLVELGNLGQRGGGLLVEVDLEDCEVVEVTHTQ